MSKDSDIMNVGWFGKITLYFMLFVGGALLIGTLILLPLNVFTGVISKTFEPNNIINNYEWYKDANGNLNSRVAQIKAHKVIVSQTTDSSELSRLRIELNGMQQSCRDLANRYNSNASKINRNIFQSGVPSRVDPTMCE